MEVAETDTHLSAVPDRRLHSDSFSHVVTGGVTRVLGWGLGFNVNRVSKCSHGSECLHAQLCGPLDFSVGRILN